MSTETHLSTSIKWLIPKNNSWIKRISLIFAFILLDYLVTLFLCKSPVYEANPLARSFMEAYGSPLGLSLFVLAVNIPIYLILTVDSHLVSLVPRLSKAVEVSADFAFAWFIAGVHFDGASSWLWYAPDALRQTIGALIYLFISFFLVTKLIKIRSGRLCIDI